MVWLKSGLLDPQTVCSIAALFIALPLAQALGQQHEESETEVITVDGTPTVESIPDLQAAATSILELTNEFRKSEGASTLALSPSLDQAAHYFANFMADNDLFGHTADDHRPSERAKLHGYDFCIVSENIAYEFREEGFDAAELAETLVEGWKNSSEHRKNMLDPDITEAGIAVGFSQKTGHFYAVQMFGRPRSAAIRFRIANQSDISVHYRLGSKKYMLEPNYTRTHELCRSTELRFFGTDPGQREPNKVLVPKTDDMLVVKSSEGQLVLE